jgi:hypothetical protein
MLSQNQLRRVEALVDGRWVELKSIGQLETGDIFRMFEPDESKVRRGKPVKNNKGGTRFIVEESAYIKADCYDTAS